MSALGFWGLTPGHAINTYIIITEPPAPGAPQALVYASCECGWNGDAFRIADNAMLQGRNHASSPGEEL